MRLAKLSIAAIMLFLFIWALPTSVFAFPKYKVALLPIMNTENVTIAEIPDLIQSKLHRKLRFPFYEFIPDAEISAAIKTLPIKNGAIIPNQSNLSLLSKTLVADIVLVVEIDRARIRLENTFSLWDDRTIETTDIILKCYAYSATDNQYYSIKAAKYNSEVLSTTNGLLYATKPVIDELLKKLPFPTIPSSISSEVKTAAPILP